MQSRRRGTGGKGGGRQQGGGGWGDRRLEGSPDLGNTISWHWGCVRNRSDQVQDSPSYPWVLSLEGSCPAWPPLRGSGLCQGDAQLDCGGCILFLELCCTGRHRNTGSVVTYFRGVLRTSVTIAMRLQANIMIFWTRILLVINHKILVQGGARAL